MGEIIARNMFGPIEIINKIIIVASGGNSLPITN